MVGFDGIRGGAGSVEQDYRQVSSTARGSGSPYRYDYYDNGVTMIISGSYPSSHAEYSSQCGTKYKEPCTPAVLHLRKYSSMFF